MNPVWDNLYDSFKDRRYGALFLTSLVVFFGLLILGAVVYALDVQKYFPYALPWIGLLIAALIWRGVGRARAERQNRLGLSILSRDELRVARSKLLKDRPKKKL